MQRGVLDHRVLQAMRTIPRHEFVPREKATHAYKDYPVAIGEGQTISQPYMVARMTELLNLTPTDTVLEIGTGSGYQAAILAMLAKTVHTIERLPCLAEIARDRLHALEIQNVTVHVGDGSLGLPEHAPYHAILVTAGAPHIPAALKEQLADNGRLVCPAGPSNCQRLYRVTRRGNSFREECFFSCIFVPLIGEDAWPEEEEEER